MTGATKRARTAELTGRQGERVRVMGWLHAKRRLGGVDFLVVRDGWGLCQLVLEEGGGDGGRAPGATPLLDLPLESVIEVEGTVVPEPRAPGGVELHNCTGGVLVEAQAAPVAIGKRELRAGPSTLLDLAALTLRHPDRRRIFRLSAACMRAFRACLEGLGFTEIATPKILSGATEGGANVFAVDYFGRQAFLAQSPQLYKQIVVGVFERVFEVGPVFRAEPHDTARHLNQYTSLDAEMGFISDHSDVMEVVGRVVRAMVREAEAFLKADPLLPNEIPAIPFWEARRLLDKGSEIERCDGKPVGEDQGAALGDKLDLSPEDERRLCRWARNEFGSDFLFVTGFPAEKRPFYTHPDPGRPGYTNSFDLLFRGLEIVTGGQRLHRYGDYLDAMASRGMPADSFEGYLTAFRYGMPPHGGFAMGLERFVARLLEIENVRETALFPRTLSRLAP